MSNISLTFVAHQPNRLIHYDFFKIGEHAFYEDDDLNARVLSTVAERCYFPATRLMKQLIELTGGKFRFGLALSGVILEQALYHRPDLIAASKELELLNCLASHPNRVYTRDQLLDEVWGFEYYGDSRTIDVHVKRLREKLAGASDKWELKTVWGVGYKFEVRQ